MGYFINCLKQSDSLSKEIKELVPDMNLRRRMSRIVKMSVSTGVESLLDFDSFGEVDSIITATGLGCIADSEKFLGNCISAGEQMLNPTPFIHSTFNTVGAQIALIRSLHGYNNTFTHRYTSFESALVDAMLRIGKGKSKAVLIGVFDEFTQTVETLMKRMGVLKEKKLGEGALFFVLSGERLDSSVAEIEGITFGNAENEVLSVFNTNDSLWCGAVARTIARSIESKYSGFILNDIDGKNNSLIKLRCL